jgi:hypothetical protein
MLWYSSQEQKQELLNLWGKWGSKRDDYVNMNAKIIVIIFKYGSGYMTVIALYAAGQDRESRYKLQKEIDKVNNNYVKLDNFKTRIRNQ